MALGAVESLVSNKYTKDDISDGTNLLVPVIGVDGTAAAQDSMKANKLYATVLQDEITQSETAFELVYEVAKNGTAIGYTTSAGISAATMVTDEPPSNDASVINQCWLIPFKPITKN
ncbi:MAG: hypothetical protein ACRC5H_01190 [Treponemataceae bacterium]